MNIQQWITFSIAFFRAAFISFFHTDPQVNIAQGILRGVTLESKSGRYFSSFTKIPYAQPPVGELRFKSPVPAKAWEGVFSADSDVDECPNIPEGSSQGVQGKEDCLHLNVFTPLREFNISDSRKLLPVMVFIFGGGFATGSSSTQMYGPNYLLDKDIVLVTMNYRGGILGFLTTGDEVAPGNFGLKDQLLALKWVQKNIQAFGGDPKRVTLFGESSGAASVNLHTISEASDGLYHQYILQSANALDPWIFRERSEFKSDIDQVAKNVGCPAENSKSLIECLQKIDVEKLISATAFTLKRSPEIAWVPTNEVESENAFLTDTPQNLIARNKMKDYPSISGFVNNEGLYVTAGFYVKASPLPLKIMFANTINFLGRKYVAPEKRVQFNSTVKEFYIKSNVSENDEKFLGNFTDLASDGAFVYPGVVLIDRMAKVAKSPSYFYRFGYQGDENYLESHYGITKNIGIPHRAELMSLFSPGPLHSVSEKDGAIIDTMVDLWTSFAIKGKPTSSKLKKPDSWKPYGNSKSFLQIGNVSNSKDPSISIETSFFTDRMNFWKEHFPIPVL